MDIVIKGVVVQHMVHHFSKMCKSTQKKVDVIDETVEEQEQHFFIGTVKSDQSNDKN